MKWIIGVAAGLVGVVAVVVGIGFLLPKKHRAAEAAHFRVSADQLWGAINNFSEYPTWRNGVASVRQLPDMNGHPVWEEIDADGEGIPFETTEAVPGQRLVRRIADPNLPFGGTWEFSIEDTAEGATLTLVENGDIGNPIFRLVSRFIIGHTKHVHGYLNDLHAKLEGTSSSSK